MSIQQDRAAPEVGPWLEEHAIRTVVVAGVDTSGVLRGKRLSVEQFRGTIEHGMPLCDVFWVLLPDEETLVPRPAGHRGYFPNKAQGYPGHRGRTRPLNAAHRAVARGDRDDARDLLRPGRQRVARRPARAAPARRRARPTLGYTP